ECLERFCASGLQGGIVYSLEGLASLAVIQGDHIFAVRLFAWADVTRAAIEDVRTFPDQAAVDRDLTTVREQLDQAVIAAAVAEGRELTLEQAIELAFGRK